MTCNYDGDGLEELQLPGEGAFSFASEPRGSGPDAPPKDSMSPDDDDKKIDMRILPAEAAGVLPDLISSRVNDGTEVMVA